MFKRKSSLNKFDYFNYIFLILISCITIYPFIYVLAGSFNQGTDYMNGGVYLFPRVFSLDNYKMIFNDNRLYIGFKNTIARTLIGTPAGVFFTAMVSYGMSRKDLKFKKQIYWFNLFTLFFSGGLIPYFLVLKTLSLNNSFWVYIVPNLYSVFNMIIFANYFREIPEEIHESAVVDGAREFTIFWKLYLPLSKPVLATIALWVGVFHWNSFFDSMLFTTDPKLQTLQLFLVKLIKEASLGQGQANIRVPAHVMSTISITTVRYAAIVVSSIPIFMLYPFVQKYLVKGVMLGSVKG
ncbi:MAG TPA: carbohydrate ABC transporter permease [Clostridiaceae bacterium]|nr:carbohydrate ABC transporter permease [Clostridiaceae bacterium]